MSVLDQRIIELDARRHALLGQLREVEHDLQEARNEKAGVRPGDEVVVPEGQRVRQPGVYRVVSIEHAEWHPGRPWVTAAVRRRKDGSWGDREVNLMDYWRRPDELTDGSTLDR